MFGNIIKQNFNLDLTKKLNKLKFTSQLFRDSSMVEHSAVNRRVVGSNPTRGAI